MLKISNLRSVWFEELQACPIAIIYKGFANYKFIQICLGWILGDVLNISCFQTQQHVEVRTQPKVLFGL